MNQAGALTWDYSWWNLKTPWLIVIFGYLTFFLVSFWVFDMESMKKKIATVGVIFSVDIIALVLFGVMLKWI